MSRITPAGETAPQEIATRSARLPQRRPELRRIVPQFKPPSSPSLGRPRGIARL